MANEEKAKFMNKTLIRTVKDKKGHVIFESVEAVVKFPKDRFQKFVLKMKENIEKWVKDDLIDPYFGNELYKAFKKPKMKYKSYHWYIFHDKVEYKPTTKFIKLIFLWSILSSDNFKNHTSAEDIEWNGTRKILNKMLWSLVQGTIASNFYNDEWMRKIEELRKVDGINWNELAVYIKENFQNEFKEVKVYADWMKDHKQDRMV